MALSHIKFENHKLILLDQRCLPMQEIYVSLSDHEQVAQAIENMVVRGAPAIGVAASFGLAIAAHNFSKNPKEKFFNLLSSAKEKLASTRPTAINLFWALNRMMDLAISGPDRSTDEIALELEKEAFAIWNEDVASCRSMGKYGARFVKDGAQILTHCNAGALATGGYGTALGVVRAAVEEGKKVHVYVDETRPFLQGARLTAYELMVDSIPVTLICDNMAGYLMNKKMIDLVLVGADRIAANGDTANKIGTYSVSILARENNVPFYVVAPLSTIDLKTSDGDQIPIEERKSEEVTDIFGKVRIAPKDVEVFNPAFDVTPASKITAIITEAGVAIPPYEETIKSLFQIKKNVQ